MSRGNRETTAGILKGSMRENYSEHGVEEYYRKVGATYRNPHYPGVRSCLFLWLNRWWQAEHLQAGPETSFIVFDMACGQSGEVTIAVLEWWKLGRMAYESAQSSNPNTSESQESRAVLPPTRRGNRQSGPPPLEPSVPRPTILAADPFTAEAYRVRTTLQCSSLSFRDIADGALSRPTRSETATAVVEDDKADHLQDASTFVEPHKQTIDMVICSFALHLVETLSELFALLWELRWLVIIAPHKKPDIKDGWGWTKWNVDDWSECPMGESKGEYLQERVHCRIYRSLNME